MYLVFYVIAFELVTVNSFYHDENTCHQQCFKKVGMSLKIGWGHWLVLSLSFKNEFSAITIKNDQKVEIRVFCSSLALFDSFTLCQRFCPGLK